jgi:hypothetical protein
LLFATPSVLANDRFAPIALKNSCWGVDLKGAITIARVVEAQKRLEDSANELRTRRTEILESIRTNSLPPSGRGRSQELGEKRASLVIGMEELSKRAAGVTERIAEMKAYQETLNGELERLSRVSDAGELLADLRVTHCPACDQSVTNEASRPHSCFLCSQELPDGPAIQELGAARLKFESERLSGELAEAQQLLSLLHRDSKRIEAQLAESRETLKMVDNELAPFRAVVSALVSEQISATDMELGELNERQRQLGRLKGAVELGLKLGSEITEIEKRIRPLDETVSAMIRATDFDDASKVLADGMNEYLHAINRLKPGIWPHNDVSLDISANSFRFKVGSKKWQAALGGTDSLYFLMAYHYGLLTLSAQAQCHYPGLAILDMHPFIRRHLARLGQLDHVHRWCPPALWHDRDFSALPASKLAIPAGELRFSTASNSERDSSEDCLDEASRAVRDVDL